MKNYIGKKAEVKRKIEDLDYELCIGEILTIISIECNVDGFGSDYVNVKTENGDILYGLPTFCLTLLQHELRRYPKENFKKNVHPIDIFFEEIY